jgi:threonine dehydrogenase-like Zn-dependent dehydrogenase
MNGRVKQPRCCERPLEREREGVSTRVARAAVKVGVEQTEIQSFPLPEVTFDTGLLRIEACGVGGSDPELYRRATRIPAIMGHEIVGTVEEFGAAAAQRWGVAAGDRVALHEYLPCWHCRWCLQGDFRLCVEADFFTPHDHDPLRYGMSTCATPPHLWGGNAEMLFIASNAVIHKVPSGMDATLATLGIPFGNGFQWAVYDGGTKPGSNVLVIGAGQQGLGCAFAAKIAGATTVILAGLKRDRSRLALGLQIGADLAIDTESESLRERVLHATGGDGVDVVVDTTSDPTGSVVADALAVAAKGAFLSLNGLRQSIPIGDIKRNYLTVRAPRGHSYRAVEMALRTLASTSLPVADVCSHTFGLGEVHQAIRATAGRDIPDAIHVTVDPWR